MKPDKWHGTNYHSIDDIQKLLVEAKDDFNELSDGRKTELLNSAKTISQFQFLEKMGLRSVYQDIAFIQVVVPQDIQRILGIGIYEASTSGNFKMLKDSLHTMNRLKYGYALCASSGHNHSSVFENVIYAFAECDVELVKHLFPEELGLADTRSHPFFRNASNLIISMLYKKDDWLIESTKML